jgi:carbon storage regulator CsrA
VLILQRFENETVEIRVGEFVVSVMVTQISTAKKYVKLGFTAPRDVTIHRGEVQDRVDAGLPADTPKPIRTWEAK